MVLFNGETRVLLQWRPMTRRPNPSRMEIFFLLLCAGILTWKLLLPGFIGMADNGDFAKVAGPLSLGNAEPAHGSFVHAIYMRERRYYYNPHVPSSENWLAWGASTLEQTFGDPTKFDIRWLGAIHGLIFLGFYYSVLLVLRPLSPRTRCALSLVALWMFADVGLIAYLNSFYSDVPAAVCGLTAVFIGTSLLAAERPALSMLALFTLAAFLFITSKAQHGVLGFVPAGAAFYCARRSSGDRIRVTGYLAGVVLLAATVWIVGSTPDWYKAQARFNLIFSKLLNHSASPVRDMAELGLVSDDIRFIGLNSYVPGGPMENISWAEQFGARTSYDTELKFFLWHPSRALDIISEDLKQETSKRYSPGVVNLREPVDGPECSAAQLGGPQCSAASSPCSWSWLRSWACRVWPAHLILWFGVLLPGALVFASRCGTSRWHSALATTILAVSIMAVVEFTIASLADALGTARHLFIFHVFTDASIFLALIAVAGALENACPASLRRPMAATIACGTVILVAVIIKAEFIRAPEARRKKLTPISSAVDDSNNSVGYAGVWQAGLLRDAFGGTLTYSDQPGATARVCFEGTELQYVYTKASNRGSAEVTIDGMQHEIDLYNPQLIWQAHTEFGGLQPGCHCAVVRVLGRHAAGSSGNFIDVDGFVVR